MAPDDTNVLQNHNASLVCGATSEPMHTTQWFKGDSIINGISDKYTIIEMPGLMERETVSILTVYDAVMNDTDDYTCVVTNVHGSQNHTAHLEVQGCYIIMILQLYCIIKLCVCVLISTYHSFIMHHWI